MLCQSEYALGTARLLLLCFDHVLHSHLLCTYIRQMKGILLTNGNIPKPLCTTLNDGSVSLVLSSINNWILKIIQCFGVWLGSHVDVRNKNFLNSILLEFDNVSNVLFCLLHEGHGNVISATQSLLSLSGRQLGSQCPSYLGSFLPVLRDLL